MPIHDWTRVKPGYFHAFHYQWITAITNALNDGLLPKSFFALPEQRSQGLIPDVLTLKSNVSPPAGLSGGIAVAEPKPKARIVQASDADVYANRANRLVVHHTDGDVVAVLEIVSLGNKHSHLNFQEFLQKSASFLQSRVSFFAIDLFPPTPRDPNGIHAAIWEHLGEVCEALPEDKRLTIASYEPGDTITAYVEPVAVGDCIPKMPLFLSGPQYIMIDLQSTYDTAWSHFPAALKPLLESGS